MEVLGMYFMELSEQAFCSNHAVEQILNIIRIVIVVFQWLIPIGLIVVGSFDLGKAVLGSKPDDIQKEYSKLIKRLIAAVVIFFIPSIIGLIIGAVDPDGDSAMAPCTEALGLKNYDR